MDEEEGVADVDGLEGRMLRRLETDMVSLGWLVSRLLVASPRAWLADEASGVRRKPRDLTHRASRRTARDATRC